MLQVLSHLLSLPLATVGQLRALAIACGSLWMQRRICRRHAHPQAFFYKVNPSDPSAIHLGKGAVPPQYVAELSVRSSMSRKLITVCRNRSPILNSIKSIESTGVLFCLRFHTNTGHCFLKAALSLMEAWYSSIRVCRGLNCPL